MSILSGIQYLVYGSNSRSGIPVVSEEKEKASAISTPAEDPARDLALRVRPVSQLDASTEFDHLIWAVTVVIDKGFPGFHARLVIEGVNEEIGPFFQVAHLQGTLICKDIKSIYDCWCFFSKSGKVTLYKSKKPPMKLDGYKRRSETWARPREKVARMIEQIKKEQKSKAVVPFSILGRTSVFTKEMEFFETEHPKLLEIKEKDPNYFSYLHRIYENYIDKEDKYFLTKIKDCYESKIQSAMDYNVFLAVGGALLLSPIGGYIWLSAAVLDRPRMAYTNFVYQQNENVLTLMKDHVKKTTKVPDSCFTWAREKLKMIDVVTTECFSDRCVAISTLYAKGS